MIHNRSKRPIFRIGVTPKRTFPSLGPLNGLSANFIGFAESTKVFRGSDLITVSTVFQMPFQMLFQSSFQKRLEMASVRMPFDRPKTLRVTQDDRMCHKSADLLSIPVQPVPRSAAGKHRPLRSRESTRIRSANLDSNFEFQRNPPA